MRIAALIIAAFGVLNLMSLLGVAHHAGNPRWPLVLLGGTLGVLLLLVAAGIWMRRILAWRLGFVAIAVVTVLSLTEVCFALPAVSVTQKVVILVSCIIGVVAVAVCFSAVWYRQKKWFSRKEVA
jgi:hypothetical protein